MPYMIYGIRFLVNISTLYFIHMNFQCSLLIICRMITRKFLIIGRLQRRLLMIRMGTFGPCCRNQMTTFSSTKNLLQFRSMNDNVGNEFVKIGAVKVPIQKAKNSELVPIGFASGNQPQLFVRTLKWMLQKDALKQDIFLIGQPGFLRANIVFQFLEICNREFEYMAITRDTTEADIKQRREIRSGSAFYTDLCAVKAAINGRVLVIDGVEKAERNVLPILNNLLENREMQLDDGRFLMAAEKYDKLLEKYSKEKLHEWKLERVSEHFSVICLGLPIPTFQGHSIDPPLRSRFQCHHIPALSFDSMRSLCETIAPEVPNWRWTNLLSLVYGLNAQWEGTMMEIEEGKGTVMKDLPIFPNDNLVKAAQIWNACPALSESNIFHFCYPNAMLKLDTQIPLLEKFKQKFGVEPGARLDIRWDGTEAVGDGKKCAIAEISSENGKCSLKVKVPAGNNLTNTKTSNASSQSISTSDFVTSPELEYLLAELLLTHSATDFCILGPRGSGKSTILREFTNKLGYQLETIVLYQDMNSRELLQRRRMLDNGDTVWEDSQLVRVAKEGKLCILDGIDRIHWSNVESISSLLHHRFLALPDGTRLIGAQTFNALAKKMAINAEELNKRKIFRISENFRIVAVGDSDSAPKWLNAQICSMFMFLPLPKLTLEDKLRIIQQKVPKVSVPTAKKLLKLVERLSHSQDASIRAIGSCLSLRRLLHILHRHSLHPEEGIHDAIQRASLSRFLPTIVRRAFESTLHEIGIVGADGKKEGGEKKIVAEREKTTKGWLAKIMDGKGSEKQQNGGLAMEAMIPSTLFFDNPQHLQVMGDMARDFELGSHLLLIGNQGVGKNKVTDRLLQLLNRPRKYMQLHRDTTIQSLTVQSTVENGRLHFEDSPLVTAVRDGLVLVIDEADKAPLHVVAILKSLLDSEPFYLSDGRRVCPANGNQKFGSPGEGQQDIFVHPNFRMIMLANRPGFPFLGNDLYALLGDLLAVHALDNPSRESELAMLAKYGPDVSRKTLELLVSIFGDLREMVDQSLLSYPYSTRELVNIVKHLQMFPNDSMDQAVRNVFDFDSYSPDTVELIREAFERKGIKIAIGSSSAQADAYGNWDKILGKFGTNSGGERIEIERDGQTFDLSKLLDPKFGKLDPENNPHIGGNQWAGGVGGYSTAGLGGVGGPFRLDGGHTVHQMPESAKRQIPEHILKKAREINRQEYAKRLKEIDMSEYDADAYNQLASRVGKQVRVLRGIIDSLESRKHERQWAKHQTSGDLDDAKLIEGMTGEKNIYRKRVDLPPDPSTQPKPKRIRLCFDVSGSMYRFNGYDSRLQRSLEAALLVMEALDGKSEKIKFDLYGHSGESPAIPFVNVNGQPTNEKERLNVLKRMLAHSQFCSSGDYTIEALAMAINELKAAEMAEQFDERLVILLSDANLDRYGIRPSELRRTLQADESVNAFIVLIGSLGEQAANLQKALPGGKAFVAMDSAQIPEIMQQIFSSTIVK